MKPLQLALPGLTPAQYRISDSLSTAYYISSRNRKDGKSQLERSSAIKTPEVMSHKTNCKQLRLHSPWRTWTGPSSQHAVLFCSRWSKGQLKTKSLFIRMAALHLLQFLDITKGWDLMYGYCSPMHRTQCTALDSVELCSVRMRSKI